MSPNNSTIPEINLADYTYDLPDEKIAKYPLGKRDSSKLLFVEADPSGADPSETDLSETDKSKISHKLFNNLPYLLPENSCLVFNESKVILCRLEMKKQTCGRAEVLLLNPLNNLDPQIAMTQKNSSKWEAIIGGKKIKTGDILSNKINNISLKIEILNKNGNEANVKLFWDDNNLTLSQILERVGEIPLPPYLNREAEPNDKKTYQTVYAKNEGSVAAPTAGLHFTTDLIDKIKSNNIDTINLTLHVGAGTFLPISSGQIRNHKMHSEQIFVPKSIIENILFQIKSGKKIIAIGTTSVRTLESIAIFGENLLSGNTSNHLVNQWDAYHNSDVEIINTINSYEKVLEYLNKNNLAELSGQTKLLILPGYKFRLVGGIVTNFHQPSSTLLLLVGAFLGRDLWEKSYDEALSNDYRFLSYGDSSFLLK